MYYLTTVVLGGGTMTLLRGSRGLKCLICSQRTAILFTLSQPEGLRERERERERENGNYFKYTCHSNDSNSMKLHEHEHVQILT